MPFLQIVAVESLHLLELLMSQKQKIKQICHHKVARDKRSRPSDSTINDNANCPKKPPTVITTNNNNDDSDNCVMMGCVQELVIQNTILPMLLHKKHGVMP
uniref:Uncharacterized protein n=1 Tax=Amphimedon queenslandica TaxID=400682 RepID=A0A1X7VET7_AMPQE